MNLFNQFKDFDSNYETVISSNLCVVSILTATKENFTHNIYNLVIQVH